MTVIAITPLTYAKQGLPSSPPTPTTVHTSQGSQVTACKGSSTVCLINTSSYQLKDNVALVNTALPQI
jgi:hypothetical protein